MLEIRVNSGFARIAFQQLGDNAIHLCALDIHRYVYKYRPWSTVHGDVTSSLDGVNCLFGTPNSCSKLCNRGGHGNDVDLLKRLLPEPLDTSVLVSVHLTSYVDYWS